MKSFEGIFLKVYIFENLLIFECFTFGVLHFGFTMLLKHCAKEKMKMVHFSGKTEEKQNSVTIIISVYGKGTVFPVKLKLEGESFE